MLAYFAWAQESNSVKPIDIYSFTPQAYSTFDPIKSRKNLSWSLGIDYH
jgi:hypothetical protein